MSLLRRILTGSVTITVGETISQGCGLVRNIVLARILGKADYGVAAMLGMTVSFMEIGGRLAIEHLVIQCREGDEPRFVAVAHYAQAMLGVVSGALIFLTAQPVAAFFDVPDATWALQTLAVLPVLKSLIHLDVYRMQREFSFGPAMLIDVIPQVLITLAVWPLTWVWRDYSVLVWLLLAKQASTTVASHFLASRPYRWAYDPRIVRTIFSFGRPMLLSGVLMFGIMQGDRFAVGIKCTVSELGVYAVAGTLALFAAVPLFKLTGNISLPLLASVRDDEVTFRRRLLQVSEVLCLLAALYGVVTVFAGGTLVRMVFGDKYAEAGSLVAWLGFAQAVRLLRGVPTVAAMAKGDTTNVLFSNVCRLSGLALAFPIAFAGASLASIAACAAAGEVMALVGSARRLSNMHGIPAKLHIPGWFAAAGFIFLSAWLAWLGLPKLSAWVALGGAGGLSLCIIAVHLMIFAECRRLVLGRLQHLLPSGFRLAA